MTRFLATWLVSALLATLAGVPAALAAAGPPDGPVAPSVTPPGALPVAPPVAPPAAPAGDPADNPADPPPPAAGAVPAATHQSEYLAAEEFLAQGRAAHAATGGRKGISPADAAYVRFFTTFAVPERWEWNREVVPLRANCAAALPFVMNSVAGHKADKHSERPRLVPGSTTLWWADVRDYGWDVADVDAVFKLQPYFLTPLVDGANPVMMFRADWFVVYATDNCKVDDRGGKVVPYYVLQYGLGREPKTKDEFEKFWRVDQKAAGADRAETGTIVDKGDSGVSQHTRQLVRLRTVLGYYWFTKDVKTHDVDADKLVSRDFIEDLFARQADAGEYIATNTRGLQTYFLTAGTNDKFKRVEFADPTIVVDRQDIPDPRVRTAKSCIVCHHFGIIPYTNAVRDLYRAEGELRAYSKDLQRLLKGFYLFFDNDEVRADNELFAASLKKCNDLSPEDNLKAYLSVYDWYWNTKVTPEQAAVETGLPLAEYRKVIARATTGRLVFLYKGKGMPRDVWDSVNAGGYVQSVLLHKRVDLRPAAPAAPPPADSAPAEVEVAAPGPAALQDDNSRVAAHAAAGTRLAVVKGFDAQWLVVRFDGRPLYVRRSDVRNVR